METSGIIKQVESINKNQPAMDADNVLTAAIDEYESLIIIGYDKEGVMDIRGTLNLDHKAILWLIEKFKMNLLDGQYSDDEA